GVPLIFTIRSPRVADSYGRGWDGSAGLSRCGTGRHEFSKEHIMTVTEPRPHADQRDDRTVVRPFTVKFPQSDLDDLHRRVRETRWPEQETVGDSSQGVQLDVVKALAERWVGGHDWRAVEARLNE